MAVLPVCMSVSSSKASSSVPKPPGSRTKASDSFMKVTLRVKKYLKLMSLASPAMKAFAPCSTGRRMPAPKTLLAGALVAGGHDAGAGAGDDHPAARRHLGREVAGESTRGRRWPCGRSRRCSLCGRRGTGRRRGTRGPSHAGSASRVSSRRGWRCATCGRRLEDVLDEVFVGDGDGGVGEEVADLLVDVLVAGAGAAAAGRRAGLVRTETGSRGSTPGTVRGVVGFCLMVMSQFSA